MEFSFTRVLYALIALLVMGVASSEATSSTVRHRISEPSRYEGYSEPVYDG